MAGFGSSATFIRAWNLVIPLRYRAIIRLAKFHPLLSSLSYLTVVDNDDEDDEKCLLKSILSSS